MLKPGVTTSEFAVAAFVAIGGLIPQFFASGLLVQVAGLLTAAVASVGYSMSRARTKTAASLNG